MIHKDSPQDNDLSPRMAIILFALLLVFYIVIELLYAVRLPVLMDEFQGVHEVYQLKTKIPYRDFRPYKTILGYYLQLPVLLAFNDHWWSIIAIRIQMVLLNALAIIVITRILLRSYSRRAVLFSSILLFTMSTFLEHSSSVRVDMPAAWCGAFSLLFLLEKRHILSGLLCVAGFLFSQKAIYYFLAGNAALALTLVTGNNRASVKDLIKYNAGFIGIIALYIVFWGLFSGIDRSWSHLFGYNKTLVNIVFTESYSIFHFWFQTFRRNFFFYGIGALALLTLVYRCLFAESKSRDWYLMIYGFVFTALCFWHKQPWPYFFLMLIPVLYVLSVDYVDSLLPVIASKSFLVKATTGALLAYLLLTTLSRIQIVIQRDNNLQRRDVIVAEKILEHDETYVAGFPLLFTKKQAHWQLKWIDLYRQRQLKELAPPQIDELVSQFDRARCKFVHMNWRMSRIPDRIKTHISNTYMQFCGKIYIYAPVLQADSSGAELKFDGIYKLKMYSGSSIFLDGHEWMNGDTMPLSAGRHSYASETPFRLIFVPSTKKIFYNKSDCQKVADFGFNYRL
jgi:hypothetical protein